MESAYCTVSIDFRSFLLGSYFGIEYLSCVIQFTRYENDHIRRKEERGDCGRQCIKGAHGQLMGTRSVKNVRRKYRTSGHGGHTAVARMGGLGDSESTNGRDANVTHVNYACAISRELGGSAL